MAKKPQRTPEQQEYRDNLAHNLNELRKSGDVGRSLAETLLESEKGTTEYISSKIEKFDIKLAKDLIEQGNYDFLVENLDKFNGLTSAVAKGLIDEGYSDEILKNLDKFEGLDQEVAEGLVGGEQPRRKGILEKFLDNLDKFKGLSMDIADGIIVTIRAGNDNVDGYDSVEKLLNSLSSFELSDCEKYLAERFCYLPYRQYFYGTGDREYGGGVALANNLNKFEGLDYKKLAKEILNYCDDGGWPLLAYYPLRSIEGINYGEIVYDVANGQEARAIDEYLDSYKGEGIDFDVLVQELINNHEYEIIVHNLNKFAGVNHNDFAHKLIVDKKGKELLINNLYKFKGLDKEIAQALIEDGSEEVLENLKSFNGIDKKILEKILKGTKRLESFMETVKSTLDNVDKFIGLNQQDVIELWIKSGRGINIVKCLKKLQGSGYDLNYQKIVEKVVELGDGEFLIEVPDLWQGLELDYQRIAETFINSKDRKSFMDNIDKFEGLDLQKIAEKLIKLGHGDYVVKHPEKFGLKKEK